ncbi:MAG TPA: 3-phosphoshikimate 1-carboxyvinyltransferase, partial [Phycisphaeraceae bacterium]
MSTALPDQIEIQPIKPFDVRFGPGGASLPGSKSLTNRALLLAALAEGVSRLEGVLLSDDTQRMIEALRSLGFALEVDEPARQVEVRGQGGRIPVDEARLELGNAGTAMRSLTAACCLGRGRYTLDGVARMRQRPIGELVDALRQIGGQVLYLDQIGYPPLQVIGTGQLAGGQLDMAPTLSSQFITALLMAAPYCQQGLTIRFHGPVTSRPYVQMTMALMQRFGATLETEAALTRVRVEPGVYRATDYEIEPDASSASYFLAAAAMTPGSRCVIEGLGRASLQGDAMFAKVLQQMGAQVMLEDHRVVVHGVGQLRGVDVDLNAMPDMAQTLAAAAV